MMEIEKPHIAVDESADLRTGKFVVEPLERGYGTTLGNSLRRVLMSALPGSAVVGIRIEGVNHEFSTIKGVREDVAEIIQNLKDLNIKTTYTDKNIKKILRLEAKVAGVVRASAISLDPEVEILNPDMVICTLDNGGVLDMELHIGQGRGYQIAEMQKDETQPIGYIAIDSKFSPVKAVSYSVETTRVGQKIDFDKLTLEVKTDGSITARETLTLASVALGDHIKMFTDLSEFMKGKSVLKESEIAASGGGATSASLTVEDMDLTVRSFNCLKRAGVHLVEDLVKFSKEELLKLRNMGAKSADEIEAKLKGMGMSLKKAELE